MDEFFLHSDFVMRWTRDAMSQDLSLPKVREALWQRLCCKLDEPAPNPPNVVGVDGWLTTLRHFLTARNEAITDNMRLAFGAAIHEMRLAVRRRDSEQARTVAMPHSSA